MPGPFANPGEPHPPVEARGIDIRLYVGPVEPFAGADKREAGNRQLRRAGVHSEHKAADVPREAIEPQIVLEADRLVQLVTHPGERMLLQVAADLRGLRNDIDPEFA